MPIKLNSKGVSHARSLISQGKVDKSSAWSMSADDENKLLGESKDDWDNYGRWHLGHEPSGDSKTKAYWKYPFGKNGKVFRSALTAIRQRAGQQGANEIFEAAGRLLESIDKKEAKELVRVAIELSDSPVIPTEIHILPFGRIHHDMGDFEVTKEMVDEIIANKYEDDIVIDYEHQTTKGTEAPAAGWIYELVKKATGLWAKIKEWTPRAAEYIRNKEYRYISAVIDPLHEDHRTGEQKGWYLHSVGLTNVPWVKGMVPITMKHGLNNLSKSEEQLMFEKLKKLLKLKDDATEDEVIKAIGKIIEAKDEPKPIASKEVLEVLGLKDDATLDNVKEKVKALKDESKQDPDPEKYVLKSEFDKTAKALKDVTDKLAMKDRDARVSKALTSGKITPAQKEWAEAYALKDPEGFDAFVEKAAQVVPLDEIVDESGNPPSGTAEEQLRQLTDRKMLELKDKTWKECFLIVQKENPALTNQYVNEMGMSEKALV